MQRRAIIIACVAVAVLFLVYWFAFRTKAAKAVSAPALPYRKITAVLTGFNYAKTNGNYTWAGIKTPKGAPIFKASADNLAKDQVADRLCVMTSPTNVRCWSTTTGLTYGGLDDESGAFGTTGDAQMKSAAMLVSGTAEELAAALVTAPVSNGLNYRGGFP